MNLLTKFLKRFKNWKKSRKEHRLFAKSRDALLLTAELYLKMVGRQSVKLGDHGELSTDDTRPLLKFAAAKPGVKPTISISSMLWDFMYQVAKTTKDEDRAITNSLYAVECAFNIWLGHKGLRGVGNTYPVQVRIIAPDAYCKVHRLDLGSYYFKFDFYKGVDKLQPENTVWIHNVKHNPRIVHATKS